MFKCIDQVTNTELISIDDDSEERREFLRKKSEKGNLSCPICKIKVFPRLGDQRLWHFAHIKSEIDCPLKSEDSALFQARAILYKWLRSKFSSAVSIEKELDKFQLSRPIDCWVDGPNGRKFAYWLLNKQLKVEDRGLIKKIRESGVFFHLIVLNKFLRTKYDDVFEIKLSATERELMLQSEYSRIYQNQWEYEKFTLPYIDIESEKLIVYRNLHLFCGTSIYSGHRLEEKIENWLISPKNGEFVFDGEHDTLIGKQKRHF